MNLQIIHWGLRLGWYSPMPSKEQEISLTMQRHHLPPLELGQWRKERLEHPPDGMSKASNKAI
jgi:hypothetical protein